MNWQPRVYGIQYRPVLTSCNVMAKATVFSEGTSLDLNLLIMANISEDLYDGHLTSHKGRVYHKTLTQDLEKEPGIDEMNLSLSLPLMKRSGCWLFFSSTVRCKDLTGNLEGLHLLPTSRTNFNNVLGI